MRLIAEKVVALVSSVLIPPLSARAANLRAANENKTRSSWLSIVVLGVSVLVVVAASVAALAMAFGAGGIAVVIAFLVVLGTLGILTRRKNRKMRDEAVSSFAQNVAAVREFGPLFLVHWDGSAQSVYQLKAWAKHLENVQLPFAVVIRNPESFDVAAAAFVAAPVVLAPGPLEMEQLLVSTVTTVFYVNNADSNNQILRFEQVKHVQLGHGDSDKSSSATRTFRLFDRVYIAGQAGIDRFKKHGVEINPQSFVKIGRPQVVGIEQAAVPIDQVENLTVLYAPTWLGDFADTSHSSLPYALELIELLLDSGATVIFRPHPFTSRHPDTAAAADHIKQRLKAHSALTGRPHVYGEVAEHEASITECFNRSDAMISDVSAVSSDYLYSGKPLGLFVPRSSAAVPPKDDGRYIFTEDSDNWVTQIERLLVTDPLRQQRLDLRDYRLENAVVHPADRLFIEAVRSEVMQLC